MSDTLTGYIESIVFTSEETGFTVARLKEPKKKELTVIVGAMPSIQPGETIQCMGEWKRHSEHGLQFEVQRFETQAPTDLVGIQKYLESGLIKGIGPVYAERIVKAFGVNTLDILENQIERLLEVPGIAAKRIEKIKTCWQEQKALRSVMIYLQSHGVSTAYAHKIIKVYGEKSIEKVSSNPFALAKDIFGIGFKTADKIAKNLGIQDTDPGRIDAGIEHVLWNLTNEGHTCFPLEQLLPEAASMLGVTHELIHERVGALIEAKHLVLEEGLVFVKPLYLAELGIAKELTRIYDSRSAFRNVDLEKAVDWVEKTLGLQLAEGQKEAVKSGVSDKILLLTGGPGTGKSTITKAILAITEKLSKKILLAAPTGRAAKRLSEITRKKAFTIHALLEMDFTKGGFKKGRDNPLSCDLIIIDEASMVDTLLFFHLLKAIPSSSRVIIVGDIDQLPSVGAGSVLKDLIHSETLPVKRLTEIFRQAKGSRIITNAHKINLGEFPDISDRPYSDFKFIYAEEPEKISSAILDLIQNKLPSTHRFHKFHDIQVLSPMKRGAVGTEQLNAFLQAELNPCQGGLQRMGRTYQRGDKVMQIRNNYQKEVFNGDVGIISEIDFEEDLVKVLFDEKTVEYGFHELDELQLAYAVSIHKYQGSECPCVIIPIHISHFKLLFRNLIYTGVTRGKKLVILIGSKKALAIAVRNEESLQRHTALKKRLQEQRFSLRNDAAALHML